MTYDTPMPLGSDDFYNSLSEDWNEPYTQDLRVVSAETTEGSPPIREAFAGIDSYPVQRPRFLQDRNNQAPRLGARQAPYFMD
jgi:hypothetical protein